MPETLKLFLYPTIVFGPWLLAVFLLLTLAQGFRDRAVTAAVLHVLVVTCLYVGLRLAVLSGGPHSTDSVSVWTQLYRIAPGQVWGRGPVILCLSALLLHGRARNIPTVYLCVTGTLLPWLAYGLSELVRPASSDVLVSVAGSVVPACGGLVMSWWLLRTHCPWPKLGSDANRTKLLPSPRLRRGQRPPRR
jgi:hypothetical protein